MPGLIILTDSKLLLVVEDWERFNEGTFCFREAVDDVLIMGRMVGGMVMESLDVFV